MPHPPPFSSGVPARQQDSKPLTFAGVHRPDRAFKPSKTKTSPRLRSISLREDARRGGEGPQRPRRVAAAEIDKELEELLQRLDDRSTLFHKTSMARSVGGRRLLPSPDTARHGPPCGFLCSCFLSSGFIRLARACAFVYLFFGFHRRWSDIDQEVAVINGAGSPKPDVVFATPLGSLAHSLPDGVKSTPSIVSEALYLT